jgi:5'-3' exonuclease
MGIPAYYKRLVDKIKGLVCKSHPNGGKVDWLWMDFNCMIYHCLRRPGIGDSYPGEYMRFEWEQSFIDEIIRYLKRVIQEVGPTEGVFIGIDGIVPMAKMRQQRLRRFKSAWLAEMGLAEGQEAGRERWDTNAITPGTAFMGRLQQRLEEVCKGSQPQWILSSWDEAGEGEHKIMDRWRDRLETREAWAIYGLDADLIVLSLLNRGEENRVWLFREIIEGNGIVRDDNRLEKFNWFNVRALEEWLVGSVGIDRIDYCFAMSFLGNDFLPSSLSYKMREDGHDALVELLVEAKKEGVQLIIGREICWEGVVWLFKKMAAAEKGRVQQFILRKRELGRIGVEVELGQNNWPLKEQVECCLVNKNGHLANGWEEIWRGRFAGGAGRDKMCQEYYKGVQWVWDYYCGRIDRVCFNWCWPWSVGPLWIWLAEDRGEGIWKTIKQDILISRQNILPTEQLCLVLPPQSWGLLDEVKEKCGGKEVHLQIIAPWLFPSGFSFESVGRRYFWECEPEIPVPSILEIKQLLR